MNSKNEIIKRGMGEVNKLHATPKKFKYEATVEDNARLPTTANMKIEEQTLKGTEGNLKKRGIPLESINRAWNGYLHKSRRLMTIINNYRGSNYQELYKRVMEGT
jgi:hypothetical protein